VEQSLDSFSVLHCKIENVRDRTERSVEQSRIAETLCILFS
jgi:hypothetical protein